jgi:hypothetical protein
MDMQAYLAPLLFQAVLTLEVVLINELQGPSYGLAFVIFKIRQAEDYISNMLNIREHKSHPKMLTALSFILMNVIFF